MELNCSVAKSKLNFEALSIEPYRSVILVRCPYDLNFSFSYDFKMLNQSSFKHCWLFTHHKFFPHLGSNY